MPIIILAGAAVISLNVYQASNDDAIDSFNERSQAAALTTTSRLNNYRDLLYSGRAFLDSSQRVTMVEWNRFFRTQDTFKRYEGVSTVSYLKNVPTDQMNQYAASMRSTDFYGPSYQLKRKTDKPTHAMVNVYTSDNDISAAIGLDLYVDPIMKKVLDEAAAKNTAVASPPFKLATGYQGFFIVLPRVINDSVDGFVLVSFRFDDLIKSLLPTDDSAMMYRLTDVTDGKEVPIYMSPKSSTFGSVNERRIDVAGRTWLLEIAEPVTAQTKYYFVPSIIMAAALVFVTALYRPLSSSKPKTKIKR